LLRATPMRAPLSASVFRKLVLQQYRDAMQRSAHAPHFAFGVERTPDFPHQD